MVPGLNLSIALFTAVVCVRIGRMVGTPATARVPRRTLIKGTDLVFNTTGQYVPVSAAR